MCLNKLNSREAYLMSIVNSSGQLTTNEAVELLGVSEATVRRLFSKLESEGRVTRNHGGIQLAAGYGSTYSFDLRDKYKRAEKIRIGQYAASLVEDGDTIYLDCGTTVSQMTRALGTRIVNGEFTSLNIITNSIANVQALPPSSACCIILVGGRYHYDRRDFSGSLTEKFVSPFYFSKCFLGCEGVHATAGFFANQLDVSDLNTVVIRHSKKTAILTDCSKFERSSLVSYARLEEADMLITDRAPENPLLRALEESEVEIVVAKPEDALPERLSDV